MNKDWTEQEIAVVRENAPTMPSHEIAKLLPGRSSGAVRNQFLRLGLNKGNYVKWTPEMEAQLREAIKTKSCRVIAPEFGVCESVIARKVRALGIFERFVNAPNPWTPEDDAYLLSQGPLVTAQAIAEHLGRTTASVHHRSIKLGRPCRTGGNRRPRREQPAYRAPPITVMERTVDICPLHHCPVSNWTEHKERLGCAVVPPYLQAWYERQRGEAA